MKLEEAKLCMRCGEVFDVPTPKKCPCCNEDSWIWVLAFIKPELKDELFELGILCTIPIPGGITEDGGIHA